MEAAWGSVHRGLSLRIRFLEVGGAEVGSIKDYAAASHLELVAGKPGPRGLLPAPAILAELDVEISTAGVDLLDEAHVVVVLRVVVRDVPLQGYAATGL